MEAEGYIEFMLLERSVEGIRKGGGAGHRLKEPKEGMGGKPGDKSNWSWETLIPELSFNRPVGGWIITQRELKQSNTILRESVSKKRGLCATLVFVHISHSGCLVVSMALDLPTWKNNPSFEQYQNHYLCPAIRQQTYIFQPLTEAINSPKAETMYFGTSYRSAVS